MHLKNIVGTYVMIRIYATGKTEAFVGTKGGDHSIGIDNALEIIAGGMKITQSEQRLSELIILYQ